MRTLDEIVAAAAQLSSAQFVRLRQKLDRLEQKIWEGELTRTTQELCAADITDEKIDRLVLRRRREGRR
jgi:hypothetical protein